ncbi:MAG: hypothetical protein ACM3PY_08055, partial [Omnitrophica WOR_2 bacterium]
LFKDVDEAQVRYSRAQEGTGTFLAVAGESTRHITLTGNELREAQTPVQVSDEVNSDTVENR